MRHAVWRRAAEQDRFSIGKLYVVRRQIQIQRARLATETGGDPARQQIDGRDYTVTAVAMKNDGAGSERFHTGVQPVGEAKNQVYSQMAEFSRRRDKLHSPQARYSRYHARHSPLTS